MKLNLLNRNLSKDCKGAISNEEKKAAADLAADLAAYSLSIDTYITITEKESKHKKTGIF